MKILVIGKFYTEGFALHIAETLAAMGHAVSRFEPGLRLGRMRGKLGHRIDQIRSVIHSNTDGIPGIRRRRMNALWNIVDEAAPEVVLVCHDFLWPEEVAELKRQVNGPVAMWFPDHFANFGRAYFMNAPYDGLFFKDPFIVHALADFLRSPVHYLPECFNPARHRLRDVPIGDRRPFECDITTAGNQHSWRVACFSHVQQYDVKMWGSPPPLWMPHHAVGSMYQGRGVYNEDKALAFHSAKIVLNTLHYGEVWGVNVRCFEAAGIGAFQMINWRRGLAQLFEDGKELVSFTNCQDMKEKLSYWLARGDERAAIAEAGRKRAHAEHTYALRLQLLLDTLAGQKTGMSAPCVDTPVTGEQA
jgi:spore maturation protein CgeB